MGITVVRLEQLEVHAHPRHAGLHDIAVDVPALYRWQATRKHRGGIGQAGGGYVEVVPEATDDSAFIACYIHRGAADYGTDGGVAWYPECAQVTFVGQVAARVKRTACLCGSG
ncbi:hypothetical protein D3C81_1805090 [compost metagenome]